MDRGWKMIGVAFAAPMGLYLLIFHHLRCETSAEQVTAVLLALAGFAAAITWA